MATWMWVTVIVGGLSLGLWTALFWRLRFQTGQLRQDLLASGEVLAIDPVRAMWLGGGRLVTAASTGAIALSLTRLVFRPPIGKDLVVQLDSIESLSEGRWFRGNYRSGRPWLILHLKDGTERGFLIRDHSRWMREVGRLTGQPEVEQ